jgi:hypothetical protein
VRVSNKRSFGDPRIREKRSSCDLRRRPSSLRIKEAPQVDPTRLFFGELKVCLSSVTNVTPYRATTHSPETLQAKNAGAWLAEDVSTNGSTWRVPCFLIS